MNIKIYGIIFVVMGFYFNLNAETMQEQLEYQKKLKEEQMSKIWTSTADEFLEYNFKLNNENKLVQYDKGEIIMYLNKYYSSINKNELFNDIKFDTNLDKEVTYLCEFENPENSIYCDHPFYTVGAADTIGNGIFSIGKSLFNGKVAIEKKFDEYEFAKIILKNEDEITQFIKQALEDLKKQEKLKYERKLEEQKLLINDIEQKNEITNLKSEIEKKKLENNLIDQEEKIKNLKNQLLIQQQEQKKLKEETVKKEILLEQEKELKRLKEQLLIQQQEQKKLKEETVKKEILLEQERELKRLKEQLLIQQQEQEKLLNKINTDKDPSKDTQNNDTSSVQQEEIERLKKELENQKKKEEELENLKKELENQKKKEEEIKKLKEELDNLKKKENNVKNEELIKQKEELEQLKKEIENKRKEQEELKKEIMNL